MTITRLTEAEKAKAREIWANYQEEHDVSAYEGQAVGIDPTTGKVWFGDGAMEIKDQMLAMGIDRAFYCIRVGSESYGRKGGRR